MATVLRAHAPSVSAVHDICSKRRSLPHSTHFSTVNEGGVESFGVFGSF